MDAGMILTIGEVNAHIRALIAGDDLLSSVFVRGEISNFKLHSSGHMYLTLKDESGVLRAVMFRGQAAHLAFRPENGMKVIAHGRVDVFARDGQYQLYIDDLIPDGIGALYIAYEQLKEKLNAEGLFDPAHKKPIPRCPMKIALVTSPTGAAVRDMLRILRARWPIARVRIYPVRVQGTQAPGEIIRGIEFVNRYKLADLIITGRGGGSIEDLWAFNDEGVARAIYASAIPVISAVGHEPDFTIADFVADLRAATPSNAAELAVPDRTELAAQIAHMRARMVQAQMHRITVSRQRIAALAGKRVMTDPKNYLADRQMTLLHLTERYEQALAHGIDARRQALARMAGMLEALSPIRVLSRGYAMVQDGEGNIVSKAQALEEGEKIRLDFADGGAVCRVEEKMQNGREENGKNEL